MSDITLKIDGRDVKAPEGATILEACHQIGIQIPTLCFLKETNAVSACRMCVVEVRGAKTLMPSCTTVVTPGMEVSTHSDKVMQSRRTSLDLLSESHRMTCEYCTRYTDCEFHALLDYYGLDDRKYVYTYHPKEEDESSPCIIWDYSKCVKCRRCYAACEQTGVGAVGIFNRSVQERIGPVSTLTDSVCTGCGLCTVSCPTGALRERDDVQQVFNALAQHKKVVAFVSPYASAAIGESFAELPGTDSEKKLIGALHRMGFDKVYAMPAISYTPPEVSPVLLSRCPAFVRYLESSYPDLTKHLAKREALLPEQQKDVFVVLIGPCTAEKPVANDVDVYLTVRELVNMFKRACVSRFTAQQVWSDMDGDEQFDPPPVSVQADRPVNPIDKLQKVTTSLVEAKALLDALKDGKAGFEALEVLVCPGGCINGGGQPRQPGIVHNFSDLAGLRNQAIRK